MILINTGRDGATNTAHKILELIQKEQISVDGNQDIQVTESIVVASIKADELTDATTIDQMINLADKNLYTTKAKGRNRVEC